jgi:hypothetical protein
MKWMDAVSILILHPQAENRSAAIAKRHTKVSEEFVSRILGRRNERALGANVGIGKIGLREFRNGCSRGPGSEVAGR